MDLAAGNWGLNSPYKLPPEKPLSLVFGDINQDGTNELIAGDQPPRDPVTCLFSRGLQVVTVLVGVYDRVSGLPWLGVVGQPFADPPATHCEPSCQLGSPRRQKP